MTEKKRGSAGSHVFLLAGAGGQIGFGPAGGVCIHSLPNRSARSSSFSWCSDRFLSVVGIRQVFFTSGLRRQRPRIRRARAALTRGKRFRHGGRSPRVAGLPTPGESRPAGGTAGGSGQFVEVRFCAARGRWRKTHPCLHHARSAAAPFSRPPPPVPWLFHS